MILTGGETLIDLIAEPRAAGLGFRAVPGGSPCNTARALGRLGRPTGFLAPIAADPLGDLIAAALAEDGVAALGGRSGRPCSVSVVTPVKGQPRYAIHRHATADRDVTAEALLARLTATPATALHLGSMALCTGTDAEAWEALFHSAAAQGLCCTLDINIRPAIAAEDPQGYRARLARMCAVADVVKLSDEDIAWLDPDRAPPAAAEALHAAHAPTLLVLTCGAEGALALAGGAPGSGAPASAPAAAPVTVSIPAAPLPHLADTVGAGDTFMAALLDGLASAGALTPGGPARLSPEPLRQILTRAARAAAITCSRPGCDPPRAGELG